MKRITALAFAMFAILSSGRASAWDFILVDSHGNETYLKNPPRDLTYPAPNVRVPIFNNAESAISQGTPITLQEEQARMSRATLIIADVPHPGFSDLSGDKPLQAGPLLSPNPARAESRTNATP